MTTIERPTLYETYRDDPLLATRFEEEEWFTSEGERITRMNSLETVDELMS